MRARKRRPRERDRAERFEERIEDAAVAAGVRVLRELGDGGSARVCLVIPRDADPFDASGLVRMALKVRRFELGKGASPEDRVLGSVRSPHVVAMLSSSEPTSERRRDGSRGDGSSLLLEYLAGGSLSDLLSRREFLRRGEVVTILVSIVRALADLHAAGFWHGSLSPSKVMFSADGRPVLVGLSHAQTVDEGSRRSVPDQKAQAHSARNGFGPSETPDSPGLREIIRLLADAVGREHGRAQAEELLALAVFAVPETMVAADWADLENRMFALGQPEPVLLDVDAVRAAPPVAARANVSAGSCRSNDLTAWRVRVGASFAVVRRLADEKRRLVLFGAVSTAVAVVTALVLMTPGGTGKASSASSASSAGTSTPTPQPDSTLGVSPDARVQRDEPRTSADGAPLPTDQAVASADGERVAHDPDDPVAAAIILLRQRQECLARKVSDGQCLDAIDQPGSMLDGVDRAQLATGRAPTDVNDISSMSVSLVERMGNAALLALTPPAAANSGADGFAVQQKPASLLVVRGEAGWRLRELFAT